MWPFLWPIVVCKISQFWANEKLNTIKEGTWLNFEYLERAHRMFTIQRLF